MTTEAIPTHRNPGAGTEAHVHTPPRVQRLLARIRANSADQTAYCQLGEAYLADNFYMEAAAMFRRAVELNPQFSAAWYGLGVAYARANVAKEARTAWTTGQASAQAAGDSALAQQCADALKTLPAA